MPGGRIEIEVVPDTRGFPGKLATGLRGLQGIAGTIGKGLGVAVAAGTAAAAVGLKEVISLGIDYTGKLNELQAVSNASALQMAKVGQTAKALGSDLSLPATSAAGAAAAMLELAKGGLTVEQSMKAAKGTLQLAAAAQIDAASAAEIQSNALNQFGLSAENATRVADVLANTSNAASGSIGDIALALKYVGPVAKSVGVSIEDTATAIGLLANKGIQADTAGTSLRGMLASLAAPSKPAAKALNQLGVEAFDSAGRFVGFRAVIEQLSKAQARMTQENFAAAASTAFGREPLAAIVALAESGAPAFDEMATAVARQGGAADVAAAKMKGLGGAWEGFRSQLETAGIEIFESIDGPLESIVRKGSDFVAKFTPAVKRGLDSAVSAGQLFGPDLAKAIGSKASALSDVAGKLLKPLVQGVKETINSGIEIGVRLFKDFADVVSGTVDAVEPLAKGIGSVVESFNRADGPIGAFGAALGIAYDIIKGVVAVVTPVIGLVAALVEGFANLPGPIQTAALALLALQVGPSIISGLRNALSGAGQDAEGAAQKAGLFGRALGLVTAPVRLVASGLSTVTGTVRQFAGEMAVQRSLAVASGQAMDGLTGATAAYRTSTIPAVEAARRFTDQMAGVRAGAEGANRPVGALGAAFGVLAERSTALGRARDSYRSTFDTVSQAADRAALSVGVATEQLGTNLQTGLSNARNAIGNTGTAIAGLGDSIRTGFGNAVTTVSTGATNMVNAVKAIPTGVGVAAISLRDNLAGAASRVGDAFAALPGKIAAFPTAVGVGVVGVLDKIPGAVTGGISALGRLGGAVTGAATAIGSLARSAGSGLVAALGGPFGVAIAGVTLGLGLLAGKQEEAAKKAAAHESSVDSLARALRETGGVIDSTVRKQVGEDLVKNYGDAVKAAEGLGISLGDVTEAALKQGNAYDLLHGKLEAVIKAGTSEESDPGNNGALSTRFTADASAALVLLRALEDLGGKTNAAEEKNRKLGEAIKNGTASMLEGTESGRTFAAAMKTLSDNTATADDKARALKNALDAFSGGQVALDEALANMNEQFDRLGDAFGKNIDKSKGFGNELLTSSGRINTATENGRKLRDSLEEITTSSLNVAQRTFDMTGSLADAQRVVQESRDRFIAMAEKMGFSAKQAGILADQMGLVPEQVATLIQTPGMTDAQKEVLIFKGMIERTPGQKSVTLQTLSAEAERLLESFGFKVTHLPDGRVRVDLDNAAAEREMNAFVNRPRTAVVRIATVRSAGGGMGVMHDGGILKHYATGGVERKLTPMKGGVASIVPPNTWRVVGDRLRDDEAYIPINQSSRSLAILRQTADQMGFALLRRFATGGVAVGGSTQQPLPHIQVPVGGDTFIIGQAPDPSRTAHEVQRLRDFKARLR